MDALLPLFLATPTRPLAQHELHAVADKKDVQLAIDRDWIRPLQVNHGADEEDTLEWMQVTASGLNASREHVCCFVHIR